MRADIEKAVSAFPEAEAGEEYWHFHLPVEQALVDSRRSPLGYRRACVAALLEGARRLRDLRPPARAAARIVVLATLPALWWESQIMIFFDEWYFGSFFERDNAYQTWVPIEGRRGLSGEWGLELPAGFSERGYLETIRDEGKVQSVSELWYFGKLGERPH